MRISYHRKDELAFRDEEFRPSRHWLRHVLSLTGWALTLVGIAGALLYLAGGIAPGEKKFGLHQLRDVNALRDPRAALASGENLMLDVTRSAIYATHWAALAWRNLTDFEESVELLKTPSDPLNPDGVAQRRRQGAQQIVILLDRHALLPLLVDGCTHQQAAERIGVILNIRPEAVDANFRQAQREQLEALKSALDRHLSDEPGKSDLSVFFDKEPQKPGSMTAANN
jgi:hypothetical protein